MSRKEAAKRMAKAAVRAPLRTVALDAPLHATYRFLREEGWLRSYREQVPVRRDGQPIPWYTYAAVEFLEERLPRDAAVFEFGGGYSTLWYAAQCARVVAVDPNAEWVERLRPMLPANAELELVPWGRREDWLGALGWREDFFDVIAVDAIYRSEASALAVDRLTERGVIVWDNSRLPLFADLMRDVFAPAGFRDLPFGGLVPVVPSFDRTSILYRRGNCLGI